MDEATEGKKPTLKARCDDLERRVDVLEAWRADTSAMAHPAPPHAPVSDPPLAGGDLLPADEIRALLGGSDGGESQVPLAAESAPTVEYLDPPTEEEQEPVWPPEIAPELLIEALAVLDTFQGKPVIFAAEPVDRAGVSLVIEKCGVQVPVIGRPIEDIVPRLRERFQSPG